MGNFVRSEGSSIEEADAELPPAHHGSARQLHPDGLEGRAAAALVAVAGHLGLRGEGPESWTVSPAGDPIGFLLDAVVDAVTVWREESLLYRNRAAERMALPRRDPVALERLEVQGRSLERRCLRFRSGDAEYVLEVISEIR